MKSGNDNRYGYRSWPDEDIRRFGKFLIIPLIAVILIVIILIADRKNRSRAEDTEASLPAAESTEAPLPTEEIPEETAPVSFSVGETPQVQLLMDQYFTAKQAADAEGIYQLFGWTDLTGIEDLRRQLQYDARYTEGYRNITCYVKPGLSEGSYLAYVSYDLKFKNSLTLAPGLLWNYVKTGEDGTCYLTDSGSLDEAELDYIKEAEKVDEIVLLKTQIYAKLRQALESDASLAESYSILERQGGSAGGKTDENQHEVTVQIGQ